MSNIPTYNNILSTIFAQSDTAATIYFTAQLFLVPIRERCLLISVNLCLFPNPFPHFQWTLNTADEAEKSDPFADIEEDKDELEENELVFDDC